MRKIFFWVMLVLFNGNSVQAQSAKTSLYPALEPFQSGQLPVSELHTIAWMISGNDAGIPVILLHGGPGGRSSPSMRRLFDPQRYRIIQFDQRGAGKSTPFAEWRENTTQLLVDDINKLRDHLNVKDKAVVFGISWGTTLALAYAERYPEKVSGLILAGVFTGRRDEIRHLYHDGPMQFYPENLEKLKQILPEPDNDNYAKQLFELITGEDRQIAERAIVTFGAYESWMESVGATYEASLKDAQEPKTKSLATLENYYMMNECFLKEDQLFAEINRIAYIPVSIINGRLDMLTPPATAYALSKRLNNARLEIIEGAGHGDIGVALGVVRGSGWILEQIAK
ncbi:MAG TPA: alpha/beta fold hydrolase [Bacteroidota bacterium]